MVEHPDRVADVTDRHEPVLTTFQRISVVLGMPVADLLGGTVLADEEFGTLRAKISAAAQALDKRSLEVAVIVMDGLIATLNHSDGLCLAMPTEEGERAPMNKK